MSGSDELGRYHRQMLLGEIGEAGQRRLLGSHALVVGCGALGTVSAEFLVRAGVGRVTIVDRDVVELTNLQRQVLFDEADAAAGVPKAEAARRKLVGINSGVEVRGVVADFNCSNAERVAPPHLPQGSSTTAGPGDAPDVIVDGTDNFETRYLLNDVAVKHGVALVYAGAVGVSGTGFVVLPGRGPCLRCLFPGVPGVGTTATCDTVGVLGPLVGMVASWQAVEALKVLVGDFDAVSGRLWAWEGWRGEVRGVDVSGAREDACVCCGAREFEFLEGKGASRATGLCGRDAVQLVPGGDGVVDLEGLAGRLRAHGVVTVNEFLVRVGLEGGRELTVFRDGRAVVRGTSEVDVARGVYAKYVGG